MRAENNQSVLPCGETMKMTRRLLPALIVSLCLGAAAPAAYAQQGNPGPFSNVVVFGDSLSDAGYYRPFLTSLGLPAPVVSILGRFTTNPGPVWSELVSRYYGIDPAASNASGFIFAQGGARVAAPSASTPPGGAQRPVSTQIDEFLARSGGSADPNALYAVWAGANDIFQNLGAFSAGQINQAQLQAGVLGAATAEIAQIGRLRAAGARYILVFSLPDIGATPQFAASPGTAGSVTQLAAGYNTTLFSGLAANGIRVIPVDTFSLLAEVRANPGLYGFTNVTNVACGPFPPITTTPSAQFCLPANLVAANAGQTYLFADGVHPTAAGQAIVAQFVEALIDGPMQYSLLAETPLRTRASHVRTLNDGLTTGRQAEVGKLTVFAAGDGGGFDVDAGGGTPGLRSNLRSASVGLTMRASESVVLGVAYGQSKANASFGHEAGKFRTREQAYSLFGSLRMGGFYGTGVVSLADIEYQDVRRNIRLGPATRTATSRPEGSSSSAYFTAGYDFALGRFNIGPVVTVTTGNVEVNSFDEAEAGSANLRIAAQKRRSEVWGVGARASMDLGAWTPWVRVTADQERKDDVRFVTATPLSLATGNSYDLPAYAPDNKFVTTALGVNGWVMPNVALSFAYYKVSGRSGISDDGVAGTVSVKF
jgi:outer membrane lipase/esterase